MSHGVVHFEIPGDDPEALAAFYGGLFGWKINRMPMEGGDYWMVQTVATDDKGQPTELGGINGGIMKRMHPDHRPVNYVNVESVDEYVAKAKQLGATVLMDKMPIPGMGYFAQFTDPQGNYFAIYQDDKSAK